MGVAITWFAKTKIAKLTFVGSAWDPGILMDLHGEFLETDNYYKLRRQKSYPP